MLRSFFDRVAAEQGGWKGSLFDPGEIQVSVYLVSVDEAVMLDALRRHVTGDSGVISGTENIVNRIAMLFGADVRSAYPIDPAQPCDAYGENCLWVVTEFDKRRTSFILPRER